MIIRLRQLDYLENGLPSWHGRKRSWVEPRSLLVYAAREWCGIKARVLAEHLHRDASMISRLHAAYVENRDKRSESELQRWLNIKDRVKPRGRTTARY
jgi:ribosome-binding protein aMBF1 (putative translation factor)